MDNAASNSLAEKIHVVVRDRQRTLFDGEAKAVTSNNEKGVFDILPEHINFLSIVKDFVTIHKLDGTTQELKLPIGIIKAASNEIHIYIGISSFMHAPKITSPAQTATATAPTSKTV